MWPFTKIDAPTPPVTCADAGRKGGITARENHRAKARHTAAALALSIGRPDLADRVASLDIKN